MREELLEAALLELVELKRMKDSGTIVSEQDRRRYEHRKLRAWREAFRLCGETAEPKP
jgi:hypothetical protein